MQFYQRFAWLLAFGLLLFAAGCGSDDGESDEADPEDSAAAGEVSNPNKSTVKNDKPEPFPVVVVETSLGQIKLKLNREKAPLTVQNFLNYVASRHYDGTIFHQVVQDKLVLAGGYTPELIEKSVSNTVRNEADNGLINKRGTIAMARQPDSVDSATCQFFINLDDNDYLDQAANDPSQPDAYGYCVFGEVVDGLDVVEKISQIEIGDREVTSADGTKEQIPNVPKRTVMIKAAEHKRR